MIHVTETVGLSDSYFGLSSALPLHINQTLADVGSSVNLAASPSDPTHTSVPNIKLLTGAIQA